MVWQTSKRRVNSFCLSLQERPPATLVSAAPPWLCWLRFQSCCCCSPSPSWLPPCCSVNVGRARRTRGRTRGRTTANHANRPRFSRLLGHLLQPLWPAVINTAMCGWWAPPTDRHPSTTGSTAATVHQTPTFHATSVRPWRLPAAGR